MDYNDNDYEGHNLQLTGEESSKISSVLRPFALPKFDFDDSLNGHLRFDSLVENEVFLGIPSQEDSQWIEDFSRGDSGIAFSSSAAESCALPRHINVWSEATSSESVEMLLKAVGQEEMVSGEKFTEESELGDQLGRSPRQMENRVRQDARIGDGIDYGNSSLPPAEVEGNICWSNQSAGGEVIQAEYAVQAGETNVPIYGVCADGDDGSLIENSENPDVELKRIIDNKEETCGMVNESLSIHGQENMDVLCPEIGIEKTESPSQNVALIVKESLVQGKISETSSANPSFVIAAISLSVVEQEEGCKKILGGNAIKTDGTERHCSHKIPSEMESSEDEHSVEMCFGNVAETSSVSQIGESVSTRDGGNMDTFVVEPSGDSQPIAEVFSSGTEINQLSEGHSILHENSFVSLKGEGIVGLEEDSDITELKQVHVGQPSHQNRSPIYREDFHPGSHDSFDSPHASFEVQCNPNDKVCKTIHADDPETTVGSTFDGEPCGEKSVIDGITDAGYLPTLQKENVEDGNHVALPLLAGNTHKSIVDVIPIQLDACEDDLNVTVHERCDYKLPSDLSDLVCDGNENELSTYSCVGVQVATTTGSQSNSVARDYLLLNTEVEDTKLNVEGDELVEGNEHNTPSCDMPFRDQSEETESQDPKQLLSLVSKEHLELKELTAFETEKGARPDFEAGKTETSSQSVVLVESSVTAKADEGHEGLCEKMDSPSIDLIVQDGVEAKYTVKPMEPKLGIKSGSNPSSVSVTICAVEMDKSNQDAPHEINNLPQHVIDNQASFQRGHVENTAEVLITSMTSGVNASLKEAEFFTFETTPLGGHSMGDSGKGPFSFPRIHACKLSLTGEGSPSTSCSSQTNPVEVKEVSHVSPTLTSPSGCARGPSVRKVRRSGSKPAKASANKGNQVKETTRLKQTEKWEKPSQSLSPSVAGELVIFESIALPRESVSIPTSSLPDLNTSATSSILFPQPFTDLQQVQLRAQIFVYGSLIQGTVPDEACMVSAFDGGRSFWAPSWRACMDRLHGQKSQGTNTETPISIRSGTKSPVQTKRQGYPQSEAFTGVANRASNKPIPSPIINPMIALSSPLRNTSFPSTEALPPSSMGRNVVIDYQAVSPLNPFQTPAIRNYVPDTTWSSQAPFPVPWLNPSQSSAYDISTNPAFPILVEPLKLIQSKESSLAVPSSTKHGSPIPTAHILTSTSFAGSSTLDLKKLNVSTGQTADTKTRKRKKSSGAEDAVHVSMTTALLDTVSDPVVASQLCNKSPAIENLSQISFIARNKGDQMPTPVVSSHYSTLVSVATPPSFVQKSAGNQFFSMVSPSIISDQFKRDDLSFDKRALNIECFSKIEEAKFQAQEAAAYAASAISQCEDVWSQLGQQKSSGLSLDAQSKLSSSAVAIAAAASVAKAAAMAAKIASVAALQAKQMAEEAVTKSETVDPTGHDGILVSNSMNLVNASPVSNLQGGDQNNASSLAISTAREASKKRIEAASAATRHAENLDAIVKAAGLAAEAVSHAGKIVAMGEPFSLSELAEARPNSYWKVLKVGDNKNKDKYIASNSGVVHEGHMNQHKIPDKDMYITSDVVSPIIELSRNMVDDHVIEDNTIAFGKRGENFEPQKDTNVSDSANNAVSDPDIESRSTIYTLSSIKEGSYVEVLKDRGDLKNAWFSANVLRLKDGEALVSYTELQSDEGSEQLKEWISIEAKDSDTPKLRIPHQLTALQIEGTRKRLRSPIKDYTWSVGDKVDAWVQDCWLEGIITETNKNEVTTLSVHFPAQGETLPVKAWHLRPTLIWSEGQWIEWCRPGQDSASKGDTPVGKRPKLNGSGSIEAKGKAKVANNMDCAEIGRNEIPILPISANEKTFSTREENKPIIVRTTSSGVEKECSRVVFGVPKPGKKRKFMEVSKHYVSDRDAKIRVPTNDSVKPAKLLVPQGSGSRGFKSKSKEFQVVGSRSRAIKSVKPTSIPSRILARKDDSTSSRPNTAISDTGKGSISNDENESGEQNLSGFGSFTNVEEATSGGSMIFSSEALPLDNRKKTTARRNIKSGRLNQGKLMPSSGKSEKYEANENLISESSEPRRSIRRIQPTSRLLEGLQSSLLISKFPSTSHGKKSQDLQQRRNPRE